MWRLRVASLPLLVLAGCGGGSEPETPDANEAPQTALTITTTEFAFSLEPESVPAGTVTTTLENNGKQSHQALFYLLNEGVSYEDFVAKATKDDTQVPQLASGGRDGVGRGGNPGTSVEHEDELESGTYAVICFIRDPDSGKSHFELGMVAELKIE